jgi:hypothetical protein
MSQSQLLSSIVPFVEIERPACPKCQAQMLLARTVPARLGIDLHTFECAVCDHVLKTLTAYEGPYEVQGPWTLDSRRFALTDVSRSSEAITLVRWLSKDCLELIPERRVGQIAVVLGCYRLRRAYRV